MIAQATIAAATTTSTRRRRKRDFPCCASVSIPIDPALQRQESSWCQQRDSRHLGCAKSHDLASLPLGFGLAHRATRHRRLAPGSQSRGLESLTTVFSRRCYFENLPNKKATGASRGIRTPNHLLTRQLLYHWSYAGTERAAKFSTRAAYRLSRKALSFAAMSPPTRSASVFFTLAGFWASSCQSCSIWALAKPNPAALMRVTPPPNTVD